MPKSHVSKVAAKDREDVKVAHMGEVKTIVKDAIKHALDVEVEDKYKYVGLIVVAVSNAGTFSLFNNLQRGTDRTTRLGNRIRMKSLEYGLHLSVSAAGLVLFQRPSVRLIFFIDKQSNGLAPAVVDFFPAGITEFTVSPLNPITVSPRFDVLSDTVYQLQGQYPTAPTTYSFRKKIPLKNRAVVYNDGNAGTIADITKNSLYVLAISDQAAAATNPGYSIDYVLRYEDA